MNSVTGKLQWKCSRETIFTIVALVALTKWHMAVDRINLSTSTLGIGKQLKLGNIFHNHLVYVLEKINFKSLLEYLSWYLISI